MKEELITLITAKLAKDKGLNQHHVFTQYAFIDDEPVALHHQSFIQKWLREEHKINVFINYADTTPPNRQTFKYQLYRGKTAKEQIGNFNSYEEALEKGLQEALKLI